MKIISLLLLHFEYTFKTLHESILFSSRIGYSAAERMAREGAKVMICSRRQENVDDAVKKLRNQNLEASGIVCHQAKKEDRQRLVDYVSG